MNLSKLQSKESQESQESQTNSQQEIQESQTNSFNIGQDDTFDSWYEQPKAVEEPVIDAEEAPADDAETSRSRKWFNSVFTDEDSPDSMDAELSDEMYSFSSDATTEITDMVFSNFNSRLHGDDIQKHHASEENKQKVKRAWELYLRWKKSYVTPSWYLALTLFITYGMDTISGVYKFYQRYLVMGWRKALERVKDTFDGELEEQKHSAEHMREMRKAREQMDVIDANDIADEVTTISEIRSKSKPAERLLKTCIQTGEQFEAGKGSPRTSKTNPDMIDCFVNFKAYKAWQHQNTNLYKK